MAETLFCSCDFSFWQVTTIPVGMWVESNRGVGGVDRPTARTAGPVDVDADVGLRDVDGRWSPDGQHLDFGERRLPAVLVVERLIRTSRWVPCSTDSVP